MITTLRRWLAPARTVPVTRWRADSRWRASPSTLVILVLGLWIFGTGEALLVDSQLGVSPWTVLAEGVYEQTGIGIGWATFLISLVVLLLWIPLRERPGLGTLANAVIIAVALGVTAPLLPEPGRHRLAGGRGARRDRPDRARQRALSHLRARPGPTGRLDDGRPPAHRRPDRRGPRPDRDHASSRPAGRSAAPSAIGTVAFALFIGPSVGYGLRLVDRVGGTGATLTSEDAPATDA